MLRLPILYALFLVHLLGSVMGATVSRFSGVDVFSSVGQGSLRVVIGGNLLYFAAIVLLSRLRFGFAAIPLILLWKGFSLTTAVCVMKRVVEVNYMTLLMRIAMPTVLQMIGLFYLSAVVIFCAVQRLIGSFGKENVVQLKRGLLGAVLTSALSVIFAWIIYSG